MLYLHSDHKIIHAAQRRIQGQLNLMLCRSSDPVIILISREGYWFPTKSHKLRSVSSILTLALILFLTKNCKLMRIFTKKDKLIIRRALSSFIAQMIFCSLLLLSAFSVFVSILLYGGKLLMS